MAFVTTHALKTATEYTKYSRRTAGFLLCVLSLTPSIIRSDVSIPTLFKFVDLTKSDPTCACQITEIEQSRAYVSQRADPSPKL